MAKIFCDKSNINISCESYPQSTGTSSDGVLHFKTSIECKINDIDFTNVNHWSKLGIGGGEHLVNQIFHYQKDKFEQIKKYTQIVELMLSEFQRKFPDVQINDYSLEHRRYVFEVSDEKFIGEIHDDCSQYTLIYYYRLDEGIKCEGLNLINTINDTINETLIIQQNDLICFSGTHGVKDISGNGVRAIITLWINGSP
jgi:hypothetical protein